MRRFLISLVRAVLIAYLGVAVILMCIERWLLYPIPPRDSMSVASSIAFEDVWIDAEPSVRLHGWYMSHAAPRASVLFFHGNGEDVSRCGPEMSQLRDELAINVLVMDYRGYGQSQGKPAEKWLIPDGIKAAEWLAKKDQVPLDKLVLWGRSLGGGVAAGVAEQVHPQAMIMECTFDSLANVAAEHIRWLPVRYLMSNTYRSAKRLSDYEGTFIQWHGDCDLTVSLAAGKRLFEAVPSKQKSFVLAKSRGHNDDSPEEFKLAVRNFFSSLPSVAVDESE